MIFASVDPAIKEKIISAHLAGKGRNQIDRELREQGIKVRHSSISNFINVYKRKHEQPSQPQVCPESRTSNAGISTGVDINNTGSPLLMTCHGSGIGQTAITTTTNSSSNVVTLRDGGPLSHLLGEDNTNHTSTDEEVIPSVTSYSNSPTPPKPFSESKPSDTNKLAKGPTTPVEEGLRQEKIAWDYYGPVWMRILKQMRREKDQRRHELLVIDRRKHAV
jgi:hypothetical protein